MVLPLFLKRFPLEKSLGYTVAVIIAAIVIFVLIGFISRAFISYPVGRVPGIQ